MSQWLDAEDEAEAFSITVTNQTKGEVALSVVLGAFNLLIAYVTTTTPRTNPSVITQADVTAPAPTLPSEASSNAPPTGARVATLLGDGAEAEFTVAGEDGVSEDVVSSPWVTLSTTASGEVTPGSATATSCAALPAAGMFWVEAAAVCWEGA